MVDRLCDIYNTKYENIVNEKYEQICSKYGKNLHYLYLIEMRTLYAYLYLMLENNELAKKLNLFKVLKNNENNILKVIFQIKSRKYTNYNFLSKYNKINFDIIVNTILEGIDKNTLKKLVKKIVKNKLEKSLIIE